MIFIIIIVIIGGADYSFLSVNLTFDQATQDVPQCGSISIIDDAILEDSEAFMVQLSTADSDVMLGLSSTTVSIMDDDSKETNTSSS